MPKKHLKLKLAIISFSFITFISCIEKNKAGNSFKGGNYNITIKSCVNFEVIQNNKVKVEGNKLFFKTIGNCLQKNHEVVTNSYVKLLKDSLFIYINYEQVTKKGDIVTIDNCICNIEHEFEFKDKKHLEKSYKVYVNSRLLTKQE
ncbi:hypothetical protein [Tenacibaculum sp. 190524A02b]|uniref:hypothetical protein n=1 Tax=Tenacibaculum vairaonense TaxID=3137860 RepID=UPI0031FB83FD